MITQQTVDIGALNEGRRRLFEHIGRFTAQAAGIDRLSELLHALDPTRTERPGTYLQWGQKMDRLKQDPRIATWAEKAALLASLRVVADYRNRLDHSDLVTRISTQTGEVTHASRRESKGYVPEPFDLSELQRAEDVADVVHLAIYNILHRHLDDFDTRTLRALTGEMLQDGSLDDALNVAYPKPADRVT